MNEQLANPMTAQSIFKTNLLETVELRMLNELATLLHGLFATDQNTHAQHQSDGRYLRKSGTVTKKLLEKTLTNSGSIAIYQKNTDLTIKWICFDFDISKSNLENPKRQAAQAELEKTVKFFCDFLERYTIPYLLEFSGNRGFHVWITFNERTTYRTGYEIQQALLDLAALQYNKELISLDLFPNSGTPTDGPGLGVKVPLSKHTRSKKYSLLIRSSEYTSGQNELTELDEETATKQIEILKKHTSTSKHDIELKTGLFFNAGHDETFRSARIKTIEIHNNGFTLETLLTHWKKNAPLSKLSKKIQDSEKLSHEERKLLVGLLCNINAKNIEAAGQKLLLEIFSKSPNYNAEITIRSIKKLSSFNFPSQEQIESITQEKFEKTLSIEELIKSCIPNYVKYKDATFEISKADVEIAKTAELNYLFLNDEAHSKIVINDLSCDDNNKILESVTSRIKNPKKAEFYKHLRNEGKKTRTLITLKAAERIATSCILKQLIYFLNIQTSPNSHGYKPNKGFRDGYIFKPWLYLWIKFVSNISSALEDPDNQDCYIIKTDIKSFYDTIPHDNLKRMLLGDNNSRINEKIKELTEETESTYHALIETLFQITELTVNAKIGVPQGPAYARYLAELYLDNLDSKLDSKLLKEEIYLYQRYVDDIFVISPTEESAKNTLNMLRSELELLGLEINNEKTSITKIRNFSKDFNSYRSQSKYAVDTVSRNFADSTTTQRNLAISEFIKLVQSDSCNDDLAFIFSHLAGVPVLDSLKREKVRPVLNSKSGRGSLYKHLFNFVLESPQNWQELDSIENFDELQSEVFTASLITAIESNKIASTELRDLAQTHAHKLSYTDLTHENIAYLVLALGVKLSLDKTPSALIINCLVSLQEIENLDTTSELISHLNTELNNIKELSKFIEAIYPLCASLNTSKTDLNNLAATFYAKLSADKENDNLSTERPPAICSPTIASKYYYLLCLFSISNKNKSTDLLASAWKYCTHIFNTYENEISHQAPDWFKKIGSIEYSEENALLLISSIVDGNIFRGLADKRKIFEKFHSLLLIYITLQDNNLKTENIERVLNDLKTKAEFYKWLIEKSQTSLFPSNKSWFEKNVIENSTIILKKENSILFRRPTNHFHHANFPTNEHNGYSEIIVEYNAAKLRTVVESTRNQSVTQKLNCLIDTIDNCEKFESYPNVFCRDRILVDNGLHPFCEELNNSRVLIFEDEDGNVDTLINNQKNFINNYLKTTSSDDINLLSIKEKYVDNLEESITPVDFLRNLLLQIEEIEEIERTQDKFYYDIAAAAALYLSIKEVEPVKKIDSFVQQYHRFNPKHEERHIYAVDENTQVTDQTPLMLLDTIENSLNTIPSLITPSLTLYLNKDITEYKQRLTSLIQLIDLGAAGQILELKDFRRVRPIMSPINESLHFDNKDHSFKDIQLINITTGEIHQFETKHSVAIGSSEHIYCYTTPTLAFVIAMHSSISKIFKSISEKFSEYSSKATHFKSYPTTVFDEGSILGLNGFSKALEVVSIHRDIPNIEAQSVLIKWLSAIPKKFHQPLTTLISAHVTMSKEKIEEFVNRVRALLLDNSTNPFLIKRVGDFNGTHRILFRDNSIGRSIESLSPVNIKDSANRATIIADTVITGAQIISGIEFYIKGIGERPNSMFFSVPENLKEQLKTNLKELKSIDICTVLYTEKSRLALEKYFKSELNSEIVVNFTGKNIKNDGIFCSTSKISENEKLEILKLLSDPNLSRELHNHLVEIPIFKKSKNTEDDINKTNLVARYQSLPKKCFTVLRSGLRHDPSCHPLTRVKELNE